MQKQKLKEHVTLLIGLGLVILIFYITGIGCPIKWLTGISCAGCGLTRACLSALQLDFAAAFSYHPLFFMIPIVVVLYICKDKMPKQVQNVLMWVIAGAFLMVYLIRLVDTSDTIVIIDWKLGLIGRIFSFFFL